MINDNHILWVERYRPRTVQETILPQSIKDTMKAMALGGNIMPMILTGKSGIGKTTVARALCEEKGADYIVINGSEERGIDMLRTKVKGFAVSVSLIGGQKVIIVDEADNLTHDAQLALRGIIEEVSDNCTFIFTCNYVDRLDPSLHSRCAIVTFTIPESERAPLQMEFFKRLVHILTTEKVKFDKRVVAEMIKSYYPDYRRVINELQYAANRGEINEGVLRRVSDAIYTEIFSHIKQRNLTAVRKWVATHVTDNDSTTLMRGIFDRLNENLEPDSLPVAIILLGKYQYQAAHVADKEINLAAFLAEVLVECKLK